MGIKSRTAVLAFLVLPFTATTHAQEQRGRIEGRVVREDGSGVGGVRVHLVETPTSYTTGDDGSFFFSRLPAGIYSMKLTLGDDATTLSGVDVRPGETTTLRETVDWEVRFHESVTVISASRRTERIVDAPSAITRVLPEEIERKASHGQLPKLLEFTPGVEVTQSGVYDYSLNTRGFNSTRNRRVAFLIDGRDVSVPLLGAQEWPTVPLPPDDSASLEFVRGPSAALYGANASSGVVNVITKAPASSPGGWLRLTAGELKTVNADFRWAGALGDDWHTKVVGGFRRTDDFSVSRNGAAEYSIPCETVGQPDCLPQEAVPFGRDDIAAYFGSARFDRQLADGSVLTAEGGFAGHEGLVVQAGTGRGQLLDTDRWWTRLDFSSDRWNLLTYAQRRTVSEGLLLGAGAPINNASWIWHAEARGNWQIAGDRARLVAGASFRHDDIDTFDPVSGSETILREPVTADTGAAFAQIDWTVTEKLELVAAGRFDDSTRHDLELSPKAAVVYKPAVSHTLRLTYNEAFQIANYIEFYLRANVAPPVDLAALNVACTPFGVECGFGLTPVLGLGNDDLELEQIRTWELGYSGAFGGKAFLTVDYYRSVAENFITPLLPQLGTPLGRLNPDFGPWRAPAGLPEAVAAAIRAEIPNLSNDLDGSNILAVASHTNFGQVDTQGIDIGLSYAFARHWSSSVSYSWFDYEIEDPLPGLESVLLPNTPENKLSAGLSYTDDRFDASLSFRWVEGFRWEGGGYRGAVEPYSTVDLTANYDVTERWTVGVNVANLLNEEHWEAFGGDILRRRALAHVRFSW